MPLSHLKRLIVDKECSSDMSQDSVRARLAEVSANVQTARSQCPDARTAKGAEVWLVPTFKGIDDWQPVAKLEMPDVEWTWVTGE